MSVSVDTKAGVPQVLAGRLHDPHYRGFASDNYAGAHPEIFAVLPPGAAAKVRWMCSWDTTETDVQALVAAVARAT